MDSVIVWTRTAIYPMVIMKNCNLWHPHLPNFFADFMHLSQCTILESYSIPFHYIVELLKAKSQFPSSLGQEQPFNTTQEPPSPSPSLAKPPTKRINAQVYIPSFTLHRWLKRRLKEKREFFEKHSEKMLMKMKVSHVQPAATSTVRKSNQLSIVFWNYYYNYQYHIAVMSASTVTVI